ncbi:MAG: methyl-accepting chemotaxis protein, partial [Betaproteobacteria bacterium]|nr:methyl-accepting chemotaxis protein [Betaproteobacteria bacterium]
MFSGLRISLRLGLAFALSTLLSVALGLIAVYETRVMNDQWQTFKQGVLAKRSASTNAISALGDGVHHFKNFIIRGGDYAKRFGDDMSAVDRVADDYKRAGNISAEEEKALASVHAATATYRHDMETLVALREKKADVAELDKAVKGADKAIDAAIARLRELTEESTKRADAELMAVGAQAERLALAALALVVLISVLSAVLITRSITRPLAKAVAVSNALAGGDLAVQIEVNSRDETGQLLAAMQNMVARLKQVIDGQRALVAAANRGDFKARVDLAGLEGFQKEMGEGLNQLVATTGASIDDVVRVMGAVSEGDLTSGIVKPYEGAFGELKQYTNNTLAKLAQIISEVRGSADSLSGAAEEVNATAQSLSQSSSEQAAGVEETSASIEQMTASISQNTENAKVTDGMAAKAAKEATEGGEAVKSTVAAMKQIAKKIGIIDD